MPKLRVSQRASFATFCRNTASRRHGNPAVTFMMRKPTDDGSRTVIVPNHSEIRRGTLKSIVEQSGLHRQLFMSES